MSDAAATHPFLQFKPTRAEAGKLSRLLHRRDALYKRYMKDSTAWKEYVSSSEPIDAELDAMAADIGQRTLNSELPLTLRTEFTEERGLKPVVVLRIRVTSEWSDPTQFCWSGQGFELRKDGSVGLTSGYIRLDSQRVWRRQLDGGWAPLVGQSGNLSRARKC